MTGEQHQSRQQLRVIRAGAFSGSGTSLIAALDAIVSVEDIDVFSYRRDAGVLWGRTLASVEGLGGRIAPASKTAVWSSHLQRALTRDGVLNDSIPTLFVQSHYAFDLPGDFRYAVYTDRVGTEGATVGGAYRSRFTRQWLRREERFLQGASCVFVMGPSTKTVLVERYRLDPAQVAVVGAGPNSLIGERSNSDRLKKLLFVGTQWDLKGGPELLEAFAAVREAVDDLELLVVGSTPDDPTPVGVEFAGRLSDLEMASAYSSTNALVIPTHMEAFGIAIVEALLHGLPCVGTNVGNQGWLIGDAGVVVPPGDSGALAAALLDVVEDYPRYRSAALRRGTAFEAVMRWPLVADKILAGLLGEAVPTDLVLP